ncbi:hypothetical protein MKK75_05720 [Methylobacterium sp. J-030]|uniref:hypothetical protein n=1 Tax=Methylobacterium sp. J-030 TaxID=2836627 RepID=UPI001FBBD0CC|nr:hypothetical protein [Methylobacterium sp. J-030]MCJ2068310.1 hypothetical protein [Methylobacterium sp. J-030]
MRRAGRKRNAAPVTLATVRALAAEPTVTSGRDADAAPARQAKVGFTAVREAGGRVRIIGSGAAAIVQGEGIVRLAPAPLDGLAARNRLDEADPDRNRLLHAAGERLRHHHYRAGLSGFVGAANDGGSNGRSDLTERGTITETMEASRRAFYRAEATVHPADWTVVHGVVIAERTLDAIGQDLGYGNRVAASVALDRLRRGLLSLAELWGFLVPEHRDEAMPADAANVNAARSDGAAVKVGTAPKPAAGRGCARGRMPDRIRAAMSQSGTQIRSGKNHP